MLIDKRSVNELLVLYELEPNLKDIYVEGISDKHVIERFVKKNKLYDVKIINIHEIEFKEYNNKFPEIKSNNKNKLKLLSKLLEGQFTNGAINVVCILDKDYDEILNSKENNNFILYTDYANIEMYLFNKLTLDIFYTTILNGFPISSEITLSEFEKVLVYKFLIRLALIKISPHFENKHITDLERSININTKTGLIDFDYQKHLFKILNSGRITQKLPEFIRFIDESKALLNSESRYYIRGHDFIHLLFLYIDKIKNNIKLSEAALEKCLFQCIDYSELINYPMFNTLLRKFEDS